MSDHADLSEYATPEQKKYLLREANRLLAENQRLQSEVAEWKREAELSKWPKERAQRFFKLDAENQRLRDAIKQALFHLARGTRRDAYAALAAVREENG